MQPNFFTQNLQTERLEALANWLEGGAKHSLRIGNRKVVFDMRVGIRALAEVSQDFDPNACGTACCVAGAAVQFFAPEQARKLIDYAREEALMIATEAEACGEEVEIIDWDEALDVAFMTNNADHPGVFEQAMELLGLNQGQAKMLFQPTEPNKALDYFPPDHLELADFTDPLWAARTIRAGLKTGVFNWLENQ